MPPPFSRLFSGSPLPITFKPSLQISLIIPLAGPIGCDHIDDFNSIPWLWPFLVCLAKLWGFSSALCEFRLHTKPYARCQDTEMYSCEAVTRRKPQAWHRSNCSWGASHVRHSVHDQEPATRSQPAKGECTAAQNVKDNSGPGMASCKIRSLCYFLLCGHNEVFMRLPSGLGKHFRPKKGPCVIIIV